MAYSPNVYTYRSGYHLRVEPYVGWYLEEETTTPQQHAARVAHLHRIQDEINRHVDDVAWSGVRWDTTEIRCIYCHLVFEQDPETGEPLCCQRATDDWIAAEKEG